MLKTIGSPDKPAPSRNDNNKVASSRNNNNRLASKRNNSDDGIDKFDISRKGMEHAKKSGKLFKSRKLKSEKTSKSWNLAKSGKKSSKSGNLTNFDAPEAGPKFLTSNAKKTFNCLRLAFTKALILWYFDLKCHIPIETNVLGYAMSEVLSQLTSEINPDGVIIKIDLG